ncbi:MAG: hypothetical protein CMP37_01580 [Rickettsiales bacterium]|nr:hypothetical protein [Rickettsiales bacterium]OUW72314.1 MAG: hypothetical protein CBD71_01620 [Rickettsiales bacterium TMED211]
MVKKKIKISNMTYGVIFASIMSLITSSTVSFVVIIMTKGMSIEFFVFWVPALLRSWPIVFILILIFVPLINKFLNLFFSKNN